jgi:hypothetical protein
MHLRVSRDVGLRVTGPAPTIAHFEAPHMRRDGEEWLSQGYQDEKCRIHVTFGSEVPKLEVDWE